MLWPSGMRAADYLGPTGPLARYIAGYEHRAGQMAMAEAVEQTFERDGVTLVEAGTGTGKTLAYLLPAILSGRKVIVSTGTRTLQDQIMEHDLPLLRQHLGVPVSAACMKGLNNYLCLRRYEELRRSPMAAAGGISARQLPVLEAWRERTVAGDRAELSLAEDAPIWRQVMSGSDTRVGSRCGHYEDCYVTRMRRAADEARLVVVNHHLFFADLAMRGPTGAAVLPDYDVVIFDEAHQVEDVATQFFGVQVSTAQLERLARDSARALRVVDDSSTLRRLIDGFLDAGSRFFSALPRGPEAGQRNLPPEEFGGQVGERMLELDSALDAYVSHLFLQGPDDGLGVLQRRGRKLRDDLATICEGTRGTRVSWSQTRGRRVSIGSSPVDVSELLRERLFFSTPAVIMTSATLSTGGDFSFVRRRLGLDFDIREEKVPSPFDYPNQAGLYLPEDIPDPRDQGFLPTATKEVLELVKITRGGAFVLCTSFRVMDELARRCRPHLDHPVFVQGEAPKASLLDLFRNTGDAVLFATASFWEGVDVPGEALRLVIIDKLPFDVPTDPLVAARCARMEEDGEKPFMKYLVPSAALSLSQGFGRLIRSTKDRGVVAILDRRIVKKGYGKVFLRSLPDASRCYSLDEVRAFWAHAKETAAT